MRALGGIGQIAEREGGPQFNGGQIGLHEGSLVWSAEGGNFTLGRCTGRTPAAAVMRATRSPCGRKAAEG